MRHRIDKATHHYEDEGQDIWEHGHADIPVGGIYCCPLGNAYPTILWDPANNKAQMEGRQCFHCAFASDEDDEKSMRCYLVACKAADRADDKNVYFEEG